MSLFYKLVKRKIPLTVICGSIYLIILILSIISTNKNFLIDYPIELYISGSDFPDFIFPLIVSLPFAYYSFYLTKNNFLDYVSMRIKSKDYIKKQIISCVLSIFIMVFIVNFIGIIFSINIASVRSSVQKPDYNGYILGSMQINRPIAFGFLWSLHKALIGAMICLFGQIVSLYVNNLFLALTGTFLFTMLENFLTATMGLQRFSLTTAFVLDRLDPSVMDYRNILIAIFVFAVVIFIMEKIFRKKYEEKR